MIKNVLPTLFRKRWGYLLLLSGSLLAVCMFATPSQADARVAYPWFAIKWSMANDVTHILTNTNSIYMPLAVNEGPTTTTPRAIAAWKPNTFYATGAQVTYNGSTYQCLQAHTSQVGWEPPNAPALWQLTSGGVTATPTPSSTATATALTTPKEATKTPTATATSPTPTPVPTSADGWPNRVFAPYVDVMLWPTFSLVDTATTTGQKFYTLAFILSGSGCAAAWGGATPINQNFLLDDINNLRAKGGNVVASFGGAAGVELAQACTTVTTLQAQYQAAIDQYGFNYLDFDIEGSAIADGTSITRRNQAIAALQAAAANAGKPLKISYTLPVLPSGLTDDGVRLLSNAIANGVNVAVVNIMAMDYGAVAPPDQMGANAIQAANSVFDQLKTLYPAKTDTQLWAMIGVTPMIGLNDVTPEVFTLSDAQMLLNFAQQKNMALLAMWSMTRDKQCLGNPNVSATCSGITQAQWDFTNLFKQFTQ
ncbi:MAG: glycosyl hydrolase family 18 protein [Caldilineaceae bacterium]